MELLSFSALASSDCTSSCVRLTLSDMSVLMPLAMRRVFWERITREGTGKALRAHTAYDVGMAVEAAAVH